MIEILSTNKKKKETKKKYFFLNPKKKKLNISNQKNFKITRAKQRPTSEVLHKQ
jgi:hypothetical protein